MARIGPLARSVDDLILALDVLARPHPTDRSLVALQRWSGGVIDPAELTIVWTDGFGDVPVSEDVRSSLVAFVGRMEAAGVRVIYVGHDALDYETIWEMWGAFVGMQGGYDRSNAARRIGRFFVRGQLATVPLHRHIIDPITVPAYMALLDRQREQINALESLIDGADALLCPVSSTAAFRHLEPHHYLGDFPVYRDAIDVDGTPTDYYMATQAYTSVFNVTESSVVAMPVGRDSDGMPIGVQLVGHRFDDFRLLAMARSLDALSEPLTYPLASTGNDARTALRNH